MSGEDDLMSCYSGKRVMYLLLWTSLQYDFELFLSALVLILTFPRKSCKDTLTKKISRKLQKLVYSEDVEKLWHLSLLLWSSQRFVFLKKFCAIGNTFIFSHEFFSLWWTDNFILFHFLPYSFRQTLITQSKNSVLRIVLSNTLTGMFTWRESFKYTDLSRKGQNNPLSRQNSFSDKIPHFSLKAKNSLFWNSGSNTSQSLDVAEGGLGRIRH